jgi:uncharacterized membrane protein YfcA
MNVTLLLICAASLTLASFLQGLTGFGYGLTAMALLPLYLPVTDAQSLCTLVGVFVTSMNVVAARSHFRSEGIVPLLIGSCVGVPLGYRFRSLIPEGSVKPWLGVAICLMVVWDAAGRRLRKKPEDGAGASRTAAVAIGVFSGWLTGAFNIGGPPLVAYLYSRPWPVQRVVAALSAIFLASGLERLALVGADGLMTEPLMTAGAVSLLPTLGGIVLGQKCLPKVHPEILRAGVSVVLFGLGLMFLFSSPGAG